MAKKKLQFQTVESPRVAYNDALHKYTIDNKPVPSVSQVCYNNVDDYLFSNRQALNFASAFGTAVHNVCHEVNVGGSMAKAYKTECGRHGAVVKETDLPEIKAHVEQFKRMLKAEQLEVVGSEILLYHIIRRICGRTDGIVCHMPTRELWVYDIKTGSSVDARASIQVNGGYRFMIEEMFKVKLAGAMIFKLDGKDSTPKPKKYDDRNDINVFLCKLTSLQWDIANMGSRVKI